MRIQVPAVCTIETSFRSDFPFWGIRQKCVLLIEQLPFGIFRYLDHETGNVKSKWMMKKNCPRTGRYKLMTVGNKKYMVYVDSYIPKVKEFIYGWRESSDNGYYDKTFQCVVKSKDHYRQLLAERGLRQKETYKYCGTYQQDFKKQVKGGRKNFEKAYIKTLAEMPPSIKEEI